MSNLTDYSTKGFLTIAQNTSSCDYLRLAYAQALSIKLTQTYNQYAVMITPGMVVPDKYREVFDHVIEVPWGDDACDYEWKLQNEWKTLYVTPFEQTLKVESDMLFMQDLMDNWALYDRFDLVPTVQIHSYRGEVSQTREYRRAFDSNFLPNIYTGLMYYRQSELTHDYFNIVRWVYEHWKTKAPVLMNHMRPKNLCTDTAFAIAAQLGQYTFPQRFSSFVHMKKHVHGGDTQQITEDWPEHLNHYFDENMQLYVEQFRQTLPFHYHCKTFITDEIITRYENALGL